MLDVSNVLVSVIFQTVSYLINIHTFKFLNAVIISGIASKEMEETMERREELPYIFMLLVFSICKGMHFLSLFFFLCSLF